MTKEHTSPPGILSTSCQPSPPPLFGPSETDVSLTIREAAIWCGRLRSAAAMENAYSSASGSGNVS